MANSHPYIPLSTNLIKFFYSVLINALKAESKQDSIKETVKSLSKNYLSYLNAINQNKDIEKFAEYSFTQLQILHDNGFFQNVFPDAALNIIIKDIKSQGNNLLTVLKSEDYPLTDLIDKLTEMKSSLSHSNSPAILRSGFRQMKISRKEALEKKIQIKIDETDEENALNLQIAFSHFNDGVDSLEKKNNLAAITFFTAALESINKITRTEFKNNTNPFILAAKRQLASAHYKASLEYENKNQALLAKKHLSISIALMEEIPGKSLIEVRNLILDYDNLARIYLHLKNYPAAVVEFEKAFNFLPRLELQQQVLKVNKIDVTPLREDLLNNIMEIYINVKGYYHKNFVTAFQYFQAALVWITKNSSIDETIKINIGFFKDYLLLLIKNGDKLHKRGKLEEALKLFSQGYDLSTQYPELSDKAEILGKRIAKIYLQGGRIELKNEEFDKAIKYFSNAISILEKTKEADDVKILMSTLKKELANVYYKLSCRQKYNKTEEAFKNITTAIELAYKIEPNDPELLKSYHAELREISEKRSKLDTQDKSQKLFRPIVEEPTKKEAKKSPTITQKSKRLP